MKQKSIPIINYNDCVSNEEILKIELSEVRKKQESVAECIDNDETASRLSVLLKSKYLLILTSSEGLLQNPQDKTSLIKAVEGKNTEELLEHIDGLMGYCDGASRKGANGMLAKLQYIREPIKNGTTVIIGSSAYSIPDLLNGTVNRTIFRYAKRNNERSITMKEHIINSYENSLEETRLTSNNARKIEFINTSRILDELLDGKKKILDCAAGTGIYAFYLSDKGHDVTATDLTPRHVAVINQTLAEKSYNMTTAVMDATDMSRFADETFDVVLNMGPFYHLTCETQRQKCLAESIRVLKKDGLLLTAYIPRFYVFQYVALSNKHFLDARLAQQIVTTGVLHHDDEKCFWTDTYYATKEEMEQLYKDYGLEVTDHFAQDGLTPTFAKTVDDWTEEEFKIWCDYHYSVCREPSLLGASNHVIIVGRK